MSNDITLLASIAPTIGVDNLLKEKLRTCTRVRGVVAYWSLPVEALSGALRSALNRPGSFYCVHMERPTDIDHLADFAWHGADLYLYTYELVQEARGEEGGPAGLLHAKMILFDFPDAEAELWVGSHNFTARALNGTNAEASVVIRLRRNSDLYRQAETYLEKVRLRSVAFNRDDIDYYKLLMGNYSEELLRRLLAVNDKRIMMRKSLDLVGYNITELHGQTIQLIGINTGNPVELSRSNQLLIIAALDLNTGEECIYVAKVRQSGIIDPKNKKLYGISVEPRRYAWLAKNVVGFLQSAAAIEEEDLKFSDYFILMEILPFKVQKSYYVPEELLWVPATDLHTPLTPAEAQQITTLDEPVTVPYRKATFDKEKLKNEFSLRTITEIVRELIPSYYRNLINEVAKSEGIVKSHLGKYDFPHPLLPTVLYRENNVAGRRIALYDDLSGR